MGVYTAQNGRKFEFDSDFMLSLPEERREEMFSMYEARSRGQDTAIDVEAQRPQAEAFGPVVGTADAFLQGISAGTADEAIAGVASLIGPGSYDDYFDYQTQARQGFSDANPGLALGSEITGGVLGLGKLTGAALAKTAGQSLAKRGGAAAGVGAGEGALYGFATGDGLENRLEQAGQDAVIGAVAGSIGGKIIEAGVGVGGAVVKGILRKVNDTPAKEVERLVVRAAEAEGLTPDCS